MLLGGCTSGAAAFETLRRMQAELPAQKRIERNRLRSLVPRFTFSNVGNLDQAEIEAPVNSDLAQGIELVCQDQSWTTQRHGDLLRVFRQQRRRKPQSKPLKVLKPKLQTLRVA